MRSPRSIDRLNAPVADVYAYCSDRRVAAIITSLRDVQKIERPFSFTSLLDSEEQKTVLRIVLRVPDGELRGSNLGQLSAGVVLFEPLSDRTTEITVKLRSSIEPATLAKVTRDYLTNSSARGSGGYNLIRPPASRLRRFVR